MTPTISSRRLRRAQPRHELKGIVVQDFRHVRIGKAGLADRADRIEIGRRKRIVAAEHDAVGAGGFGEPAQLHRIVQIVS